METAYIVIAICVVFILCYWLFLHIQRRNRLSSDGKLRLRRDLEHANKDETDTLSRTLDEKIAAQTEKTNAEILIVTEKRRAECKKKIKVGEFLESSHASTTKFENCGLESIAWFVSSYWFSILEVKEIKNKTIFYVEHNLQMTEKESCKFCDIEFFITKIDIDDDRQENLDLIYKNIENLATCAYINKKSN